MTDKAIVVGYDGSDSSELAIAWAMSAARARACPVRIVHVAQVYVENYPSWGGIAGPSSEALLAAAEGTLARGLTHARQVAPDVDVRTRLATGGVAASLLDDAESTAMIVVGSRGLGSFSQLLVGSTGIELATHAHCPVVVIRPDGADIRPGPDAGRVVVGVDGSVLSEDALGFAFEEAAGRGAALTAIHVWQVPYFEVPGKGAPVPGAVLDTEFRGAELQTLNDALAGWQAKFPLVEVRSVVVHGDPVSALVAASAGAELLVVGSRGRGGFRSLLLGSISHAVLHHARCPVAVVRSPAR